MKVEVRLRDTQTGDEGVHAYEQVGDEVALVEFMWQDGCYACDCARGAFLDVALRRPIVVLPCSDERIVIVSATIDGVPQDWK